MKEIIGPISGGDERLTKQAQERYSKGGDNFMAENGAEKNSIGVNEATRRIEMAAKTGEEARIQTAAKEFLERNKENLNVEVKRVLEETIKESGIKNAFSAKEQQPEIKIGSATWKTKDNDQPVKVTGYAGKGSDGRDYVYIEGSQVGIPLDEIIFPKNTQEDNVSSKTKGKKEETESVKQSPKAEAAGAGGQPPKTPENPPGVDDEFPKEPSKNPKPSESNKSPQKLNIFADIGEKDRIPAGDEDLKRRAMEELEKDETLKSVKDPAEKQRIVEGRIKRLADLRQLTNQIENKIKKSAKYNMLDPDEIKDCFDQLNSIDAVSAEPYLKALGEISDQLREKLAQERHPEQETEAIRIASLKDTKQETKEQQQTKELKNLIKELDPDDPISGRLLSLIAENSEASEMFVNKIICKPFAAKDSDYRLSWYAEINLQSFLTRVKNLGHKGRYEEYVNQHEMALRLHEMNRATATQSGNIEGFQNIARTVTPRHLQTGTEIDGVETVRQLLEVAFGRYYASEDRVKQELYEPQIEEWTQREFTKLAKDGVIRSTQFKDDSVKDGSGQFRKLEDWEIERAFAIGRNFHSAFYRMPELVSWSHVAGPVEEWLRSMPAETVVRVMAGPKMLYQRFRSARTTGGPEYISMLFDDYAEEYNKNVYEAYHEEKYKKGELKKEKGEESCYKEGINKFGKLNIREDVYPVGAMKTGGFDKGWRPVGSYLGSKQMNINIHNLRLDLTNEKAREILDRFVKNVNKGNGEDANLADFVANTTDFVNEYHTQQVEIDGVTLPKSFSPVDVKQAKEDIKELLLPLLGVRELSLTDITAIEGRIAEADGKKFQLENFDDLQPRDTNARKKIMGDNYKFDAKDFLIYDSTKDQVNFSLGVMISAVNPHATVKEVLWKKTAEALPLRMAYILAEQGVKDLEGYENFKDTTLNSTNLFSEEFESKLIRLQIARIEKQKQNPNQAIKLETLFGEMKLTDQETTFIKRLQDLGRKKAFDLTQIDFPHIPFLDDVPFQKADFIKLGGEVFPRRMGGDFSGYAEANKGFGHALDNLGSYKEFDKGVNAAIQAVSGPEGLETGQDVGYKLYKTYFRMAKQWPFAKIPGVRQISNLLNKPTSWLQTIFGPNGQSLSPRELNFYIRNLAENGRIRFKKLPGKNQSQMSELLRELSTGPLNVAFSELLNALIAYLLYSSGYLMTKTAPEKQN